MLHANPELVRGIGIISPPVSSKASRDSWTTGRNARSRTVGVAPGASAKNGQSMLVTYADGTSKVVPITSSKTRRPSRGTAPQSAGITEVPRYNRFNERI